MQTYSGTLSSLGNHRTITTQVVREDASGRQHSGMFDTQHERFIDGLTIGAKTFGRVSCPPNLYGRLEQGKEAVLFAWLHPFLGFPPLRVGLVGIAYPDEERAYIIGIGQLLLSLVALALLPLLWCIPAFILGGLLSAVLPSALGMLLCILLVFAPWIAGGLMVLSYVRMKGRYPYAVTPS